MSTVAATHIYSAPLTSEKLLEIANFRDESSHAISFYFGLAATPDNSHREEVIRIKRLIQEMGNSSAQSAAGADVKRDLEGILAIAEEIRLNPSRQRTAFACAEKKVWWDIELPATVTISHLHSGRYFELYPLMLALQSCTPYCVALLETGKARAFSVRGTEIQEINGELPNEDLSLHAEDSRVGWSRRVDTNVEEHEKAYFKKLVRALRECMKRRQCERLVVGCREDLWGEIAPQFGGLKNASIAGQFHLPGFACGEAEVLSLADPVMRQSEHRRHVDLLREINEQPSRAALGMRSVLQALVEGRVQRMVLSRLPGQTISECNGCKRMSAEAGSSCIACGSTGGRYMAAEEGLIRQAVKTNAEILAVDQKAIPGFSGAAALLRY